jgi:uncharacterized protein (UPF0333 family)
VHNKDAVWVSRLKAAHLHTLLFVRYTTKYLRRGIYPLMATKLKGMTSLEIAIIVAIVLIIAVAVGWYLYTTFVASTTGQPRLNVVSAEITASKNELKLVLVNPGPVDVQISAVEVGGQTVTQTQTITVGQQATVTVTVSGTWTPGTMVPGRVILSGGQSFPFNALVKP